MAFTSWVEVLVDCPGAQGLYIYGLPDQMVVQPGDILSVPFGAQQLGAIATRHISHPPQDIDSSQIRPIDSVISSGFFSPSYWQLLERVAEYYQTPLVTVVRTALPPGLLAKSQRRIRLKLDQIPPDGASFVSPAAQQILALLQQSATGDYTWQHLQRQGTGARKGLGQLLKRGWVESYLVPPQPVRPKQRQAVTLIPPALGEDTLTTRQREILAILQREGGDLWLSDALQRCRTTSGTLKNLAEKGYLVIEPREVLRTYREGVITGETPKTLTTDQTAALAVLNQVHQATQILLHGVTGSGKTEVYLQAIAPRIAAHQSALVLVPEIGLTPQLTDRFRSRFGNRVCVYHSGLSDGERYDTWRQMLSGEPQIVIGTRSAIFAPLPHLGLIILDEEHDSSFKQDQPAPCYHARTVAQWRAQLENCPLILGSATPSLETWLACHPTPPSSPTIPGQSQGIASTSSAPSLSPLTGQSQGIAPTSPLPQAHYLPLPQRVHARPHPPIEVVDMRQELQDGNRSIFSRSLQTALQQMKAEGSQGLLFIHRRGHSSFVSCRSCGYVVECPHCDVSLAYHKPHSEGIASLRCHYCGHSQSHPTHCPACESPYLKHFGSGTQRVVQELQQTFPDLTCLRFDSDTTRTKGSHRALLSQFAQGEADLLVGTQMLTKGIDLPQVTVVGVMAADGLLYMGDYWASERAFQTLTQVAGRAGRGDQPGQVILQTYTPENGVIAAVTRQDYAAFAHTEIEQRRELDYPPFGHLVLLRISSPDPGLVHQAADAIAADIKAQQAQHQFPPCTVLGPVPAPILRIAQRYRWHVMLKFPLGAMTTLPDLTALRRWCPDRVSLTIDVDPLNLS